MIEWVLSIDQRLVPFMQIAASSAVALMGVVVSIVVGRIGYRNNFGWKPVVLVTEQMMAESPDLIDSVRITTKLEVLNRRKYPIRLEWLFVEFASERAEFDGIAGGWYWLEGGKKFARQVGRAIDANAAAQFEFVAIFKTTTGAEFHDTYTVDAHYYDLRGNKNRAVSVKQTLDMRQLFRPIEIPPTS
jgi:hypothetical protein